jgi:hypothetical protein
MDAAQPMDHVAAGATRSVATRTIAGDSSTGRPGLAGGLVPRGVDATPDPYALQSLSATSTGSLPTAPHPSSPVNFPGPNATFVWWTKLLTFPISPIGKFFFTQNGVDRVCSAAATYGGDPSQLDTVWTAGHCVSDGAGSFDTNGLFCPSYKPSGPNPVVGCWAASSFGTTAEWHTSADYSRDYGVVFTDPSGGAAHTHIMSVTGGLGFAWDFGRDQLWMVFGYSAGSFAGSTRRPGRDLIATAAEHRYDVSGGSGPDQMSIGSGLGPGADGGPWVLAFSRTGGYIGSNTSYWVTAGANGDETGVEVQGPYYDTRACNDWSFFTNYSGGC